MKALTLHFSRTGKAVAIYDDALLDAIDALGKSTKRRASHVEPCADGSWQVDMSPVGGPTALNHKTYRKRADALAAEVEWLREHLVEATA